MRKLCIYHGNCADGFTAAWVVRKAYNNDIDFHVGIYQDPPPDVTGRDVIIVDFSYKRPVIEEMLKTAKSITIIDHHKSAIEDLEPLQSISSWGMDIREPLYLILSTEYSGAMLAWLHFFKDKEPPQLIKHVQDRDLWQFKLYGTREIQSSVFSYPYDFEVWDKLMVSNIDDLIAEGKAIDRKHLKDVDELINVSMRRMNIGGYNVPVANLPYTLASDAGHKMGRGEPFAACYMDGPTGRTFSLRSAPDGVDVSEIAKRYGGGGHKHAAGFKVTIGWEGEQ